MLSAFLRSEKKNGMNPRWRRYGSSAGIWYKQTNKQKNRNHFRVLSWIRHQKKSAILSPEQGIYNHPIILRLLVYIWNYILGTLLYVYGRWVYTNIKTWFLKQQSNHQYAPPPDRAIFIACISFFMLRENGYTN